MDVNTIMILIGGIGTVVGGGLAWLGKYIFDFWKAKKDLLATQEANVSTLLTKQLSDMQDKFSKMEGEMKDMRAREVECASKSAAMEVKIQFLTETVASQAKKIELLEKAERLDMPRESK